jgi:hypothetical protein
MTSIHHGDLAAARLSSCVLDVDVTVALFPAMSELLTGSPEAGRAVRK